MYYVRTTQNKYVAKPVSELYRCTPIMPSSDTGYDFWLGLGFCGYSACWTDICSSSYLCIVSCVGCGIFAVQDRSNEFICVTCQVCCWFCEAGILGIAWKRAKERFRIRHGVRSLAAQLPTESIQGLGFRHVQEAMLAVIKSGFKKAWSGVDAGRHTVEKNLT